MDGEITQLNRWLTDWEAELMINISPKIGIGIATSGAFNRQNESALTYTYIGSAGPQITVMTYEPEINVSSPIKLGIYYTLQSQKKRIIFLNAGVGYYTGKMTEYFKYEVTVPSGGYGWSSRYWETERKSSLGFHGGVGIEYFLTKSFALVAEVQARYVRINDFKATAQYESSDSMYNEVAGTLYYFTMYNVGIGARYADLEVWEEPPEISIWDLQDVRKASLNLGGVLLRVGIRIKIF